jgi:hypothetical protein
VVRSTILLLACLAAAPAVAQSGGTSPPAPAPSIGDTQTQNFGPVTGQTNGTCAINWPLAPNAPCIEMEDGSASAAIDWTAPDGWTISAITAQSISGSQEYLPEPAILLAGGNSLTGRHLRRAYAIAIKMATLAKRTDAVTALTAERDRLLAAYGTNLTGTNRIQMTGGCQGDSEDTGSYGCSVTISASVSLVYVGPDDPFALLVSLIQRFKL